MTTSSTSRVDRSSGWLRPSPRPGRYWLLIAPFVIVFLGSAALNVFDPAGSRADYLALGFPEWSQWWATTAKLLGLAAIVWGRSRVLSTFAYAGFLYDLLLAITAHVDYGQWLRLLLAVLTLAFTAVAYWAETTYTWRSVSWRSQ